MSNVRDCQDRPRRLCAATNFAREFGALNTSALKPRGRAPVFLWITEGKRPAAKSAEIAIPGPAPEGSAFTSRVLTSPGFNGRAARGD